MVILKVLFIWHVLLMLLLLTLPRHLHLQAKHQAAPRDHVIPVFHDGTSELLDSISLPSTAMVSQAIKFFPSGSAGDITAFRPQHLKELTSCFTGGAAEKLLESLAQFAALVMAGQYTSFVRPIFFGANLTALTKKGSGIHSIAVGNTLCRFVAKIVTASNSHVTDHLQPTEVGFGIRGGCEAAAHAVHTYTSSSPPDSVL